MQNPHIQILLAGDSQDRRIRSAANWVGARFGAEFDRPAEIIDIHDWALPSIDHDASSPMGINSGRLQQAWAATIERADAFIFMVAANRPGYSGVLKNAIDAAASEWLGKPVAFVTLGSASAGQLEQVMAALHAMPLAQTLDLRSRNVSAKEGIETTEADQTRLSEIFSELMRQQAALNPLRPERPARPWAGRRIQVIGLDPGTNQGVVAPLRAAGFDAHGLIYDKNGPLPDGKGFDMLAGGGGTAGKALDAIRDEVHRHDPGKPVLQVLAPVAIRQIISAWEPTTPRFEVQDVRLTAENVSLRISGDEGRISVTAYELLGRTLVPHQLAQIRLYQQLELTLGLPERSMFLVVDLDGVAFWQRRIPEVP